MIKNLKLALTWFLSNKAAKELVISILEKLVDKTDNNIDNHIVTVVKRGLNNENIN